MAHRLMTVPCIVQEADSRSLDDTTACRSPHRESLYLYHLLSVDNTQHMVSFDDKPFSKVFAGYTCKSIYIMSTDFQISEELCRGPKFSYNYTIDYIIIT